ncbi:unnamed protein product [Agarophyton chilense]
MWNLITNLSCHAVANLYASYNSYRALKNNASNVQLIHILITWLFTTVFLMVSENVLDPLFGQWVPFYFFMKLLIVGWMVYPGTRGACYVFAKYVEPALPTVPRRPTPS